MKPSEREERVHISIQSLGSSRERGLVLVTAFSDPRDRQPNQMGNRILENGSHNSRGINPSAEQILQVERGPLF